MTNNVYHIGDTVRLVCEFRTIDRVLTDPTTVTLEVKAPNANTVTYTYVSSPPSTLKKQSTGIYYYDLALSAASTWQYRWLGTGPVAQADQGAIHVQPKNT